jgi:hypothetical protein
VRENFKIFDNFLCLGKFRDTHERLQNSTEKIDQHEGGIVFSKVLKVILAEGKVFLMEYLDYIMFMSAKAAFCIKNLKMDFIYFFFNFTKLSSVLSINFLCYYLGVH